MSDTLRTDANTGDCRCHAVSSNAQSDVVSADFARTLERDLMASVKVANETFTALTARREECARIERELAAVTKERDLLRESFSFACKERDDALVLATRRTQERDKWKRKFNSVYEI